MTTDPYDLAKATAMLVGYDLRWGAEKYETIAVEAQFDAPLINPASGKPSKTFRLGGKLDVLVRDERSDVAIVEHKTASGDAGPGSDYVARLRIDGQVSVYFQGAQALGHPASRCIYDVLHKPAQRPLKATPVEARKYTKDGKLYAAQRDRDETPDEYRARVAEAISASPDTYYQRADVVRLENELAEGAADIWDQAVQIREAARSGRWPRNPDSCVRYGRTCEFFGVCTGVASLNDPSLFRHSDEAHGELVGASAATLTHSRMAAHRACQRLHHLRYDLGYRPAVDAESLRFGSLVHRGLEGWWTATTQKLDAALAAMTADTSAESW
jgi:hypothetical protein